MNTDTFKASELMFRQSPCLFEPRITALNGNPFMIKCLPFFRTSFDMIAKLSVILDRLVDRDLDGWYEQCLQCSYRHELKDIAEFKKLPVPAGRERSKN